MTSRDPKEVERAFRHQRWLVLVSNIKRSWGVLAFVGVSLLALTYYIASPVRVVETARGIAVGAHLPASEDNSALMRLAVRLESGETVVVQLPRGTPYLRRAEVEVEMLRREWPPHSLTYRFIGYSHAPSP